MYQTNQRFIMNMLLGIYTVDFFWYIRITKTVFDSNEFYKDKLHMQIMRLCNLGYETLNSKHMLFGSGEMSSFPRGGIQLLSKMKLKSYVKLISLSKFCIYSFHLCLSCFSYIFFSHISTIKNKVKIIIKQILSYLLCSRNLYNHLSE